MRDFFSVFLGLAMTVSAQPRAAGVAVADRAATDQSHEATPGAVVAGDVAAEHHKYVRAASKPLKP